MKDKVVIIGSTGSIGTQTIDVIETVGDKEIVALACKSSSYIFEVSSEIYRK